MVQFNPMADVAADELQTVLTAFGRVRSVLAQDSTRFWLKVRLSPPQFSALATVNRLGRVSGRQLARELGVSPGAVVALGDRLQQRGLIERVPDDADRRITWFQLTPEGRAIFEDLAAVGRRELAPALTALSPEDRAHLARILHTMASALERERADRERNGE
jgi:MarR family transcriptional regulator, 2-MHQ and catechol-resistance regulon repressor